MSEGYFGKRTLLYLDNLHHGLITSSHILHKHGIFDAYGHISVRNPDNKETFFLPQSKAPALISSADEILEYKIADGESVEEKSGPHFAERFIHSEIYKKFPNVNAVVHSHCSDILPFSISEVPLKACIHTAGFLGTGAVPVWDIASAYSSGSSTRHDLLVRSTTLAHSLAAAFSPATSTAFVYNKVRSALPSQLGGSANADTQGAPVHPVVLMRGHGFTTCAESLEAAVYQAVYTAETARVTTQTVALSAANESLKESAIKGQVDVEGGGKIKNAKVEAAAAKIKLLSDREADDAAVFNSETVKRPWELWGRETEADPLYVNKVKRNDKDA